MNERLREVQAALERIRHHEVMEFQETRSRSENTCAQAYMTVSRLGLRLYWNFAAVHYEALAGALAALEQGPVDDDWEALAWRGRLRRLLGERAAGRADLDRSWSLRPSALAAGWRGESLLGLAPRQAGPWLDKALSLDPGWCWAHLWRGAAWLAAGSWDRALRSFDRFEAAAPAATPLLPLLRGQTFLSAGELKAAVSQAQAAARIDPAGCAGFALASHAQAAAGDLAAAAASYGQARDRDPELGCSHLLQVLGRRSQWREPTAYLESLDALIRREPGLAVLYVERAELKRDPRLCLYDQALADYERAAELEPGSAWALAVLARARDGRLGAASAAPAFDRAVGLAPHSGWIRAWRGQALSRRGEPEAALADLDAALEAAPWYHLAYAWRGALLCRLRRHPEGQRALGVAIRLDPDYVFPRYERFRSRLAGGDALGAAADLDQANRLDPRYSWLGRSGRGEAAEAEARLAELDRALERHPGAVSLRAWRGYSLLQMGRAQEAAEDLETAARLEPARAVIRAWRGWAFHQSGSPERAAQAFREALALEPGLGFAWSLLADVEAERGYPERALEALASALVLSPASATLHYRKAVLEERSGRKSEALASVEKALALDRSYADAQRLRSRIVGEGLMSGKLYLVGLGLDPAQHATLEGLQAMAACAVVFCEGLTEEEQAFLRGFCAELRPLPRCRDAEGGEAAEAVLKELAGGRSAALATRGHPFFWGPLAGALLRRCEQRGLAWETFGAVSAIGVAMSATGRTLGEDILGVQAFDYAAVASGEARIHPAWPVALYFFSEPDPAVYARALEALRAVYPAGVPVAWCSGGLRRDATTLQDLPGRFAEITGGTVLVFEPGKEARSRWGELPRPNSRAARDTQALNDAVWVKG